MAAPEKEANRNNCCASIAIFDFTHAQLYPVKRSRHLFSSSVSRLRSRPLSAAGVTCSKPGAADAETPRAQKTNRDHWAHKLDRSKRNLYGAPTNEECPLGNLPTFYVPQGAGTASGAAANDDDRPEFTLSGWGKGVLQSVRIGTRRDTPNKYLTDSSENLYYDQMSSDFDSVISKIAEESGLSAELSANLSVSARRILSDLFKETAKIIDGSRSHDIQKTKAASISLPDTAPELYTFRKNRKENPLEFFERVWKSYRDAGILFRADLVRLDSSLCFGMYSYCKRHGIDPATVIPPTTLRRTEAEVVQGLARTADDEVSAALTLAMRRIGGRLMSQDLKKL